MRDGAMAMFQRISERSWERIVKLLDKNVVLADGGRTPQSSSFAV
jgi:hypothetical protein